MEYLTVTQAAEKWDISTRRISVTIAGAYTEPVQFRGKNIYISTEWFDESRKDLVEWYKRHT